MLIKATRWLFALLVASVTVWSFRVPDVDAPFQRPELARIIFFHLPCAFTGTIFFFAGCWYSCLYLSRKTAELDAKASAANELALIFFALTMATGVLFSYVQWGAWWQSDPRQISFLLVLLIQSAYVLLRMAFSDFAKRAASSAVYNASSLLPAIFLIFVFPRLPQVLQVSQHPSNTIQGGLLRGEYAYCFLAVWAVILAYSIWLFRTRVAVQGISHKLENDNGIMGFGGNSAGGGVVRPVPLSNADGTEPSEPEGPDRTSN